MYKNGFPERLCPLFFSTQVRGNVGQWIIIVFLKSRSSSSSSPSSFFFYLLSPNGGLTLNIPTLCLPSHAIYSSSIHVLYFSIYLSLISSPFVYRSLLFLSSCGSRERTFSTLHSDLKETSNENPRFTKPGGRNWEADFLHTQSFLWELPNSPTLSAKHVSLFFFPCVRWTWLTTNFNSMVNVPWTSW